MKLAQYLKLQNKYLIFILLIMALIIVGFLSGGYFTGKVISENCHEVESCVNKTIKVCDEFVFQEVCGEECSNETSEECSDDIEIVCEEVCSEVDNETICEEVCEEVVNEICEEVVSEICEEVCSYPNNVSADNCADEVIISCSFESVCDATDIPIVSEPPEEGLDEVVFSGVEILEEIGFDEDLIPLSDSEKNILKLRSGSSVVSRTKSEIVNGKLVVKIEIGDYWVEKAYPYSNDADEMNRLIGLDELRLMKNIVSSGSEVYNEKMEAFLSENEI